MTKGKYKGQYQGKHKTFTINLKHDGIFDPYPFSYRDGDEKQLNEWDFEGMSYADFFELMRKLVHTPIYGLYYCKVGLTIKQGLCSLENDEDLQEFMRVGYESKWVVDLYTEHLGYNAMDFKVQKDVTYDDPDSSDAYCSSDDEDLEYVDYYHEREQNVVIKNISTNDPFLTKLCSNQGHFSGFMHDNIPASEHINVEDPEFHNLDPKNKVERGIAYPRHNPLQPWNEMQPILGMKFDHPEQLKLCLANYGVAGGYQLWFEKNDWRQLLAYCGRDVAAGRCASHLNTKSKAKKELFPDANVDQSKCKKTKKKPVEKKKKQKASKKNPFGEGTSSPVWTKSKIAKDKKLVVSSKSVSPVWTKSKIANDKKQKAKCGFRLWASWMGIENSFQIKSLKAEHRLQLGRLWDYQHALLDTNPGSTCVVDEEATEHGHTYFLRMYVCFKGVADGWKAGCRRVIGLDGCFLKHTCRGELLTAIGRDANNQMYPIAWAVVKVENYVNWAWFLSLLHEDLQLGHGNGITVISDSHKGLLDAVSDWLPNAEHRKCTRHVFANFKRKFSGVHLQRLFWSAASTTVEQHFYNKMDQLKRVNEEAYNYLVQRNRNTWCRAFFDLNSKCPSFENGIAESFNRAILVQRTKPIITMLEDIRLYVMQRLVHMHHKAMNLEDTITPSVKKRLSLLIDEQRLWTVAQSGFQELEVRRGDESYGVNIHLKKCMCRLWELSGIPCVHAVCAYLFLNKDPEEGVDHCYSQQKWFEAYQFNIKPIYGSNMWKGVHKQPLLPPIVKRMPGRPKKQRVKAVGENNGTQVSRVGRQMTCTNCYEKGHNKRGCDKDPIPKPPTVKKPAGRRREEEYSHFASNRGGGRGSRGRGGRGEASGGRGEAIGGRGEASGGRGEASGGRGEAASGGRGEAASGGEATGDRGEAASGIGEPMGVGSGAGRGAGRRGRGRGVGRGAGRGAGRRGRGRGRGGRGKGMNLIDEQEMTEADIRECMEHEYMENLLLQEEEKMDAAAKAMQDEFDAEALRMTLEEEARSQKRDEDWIREEERFELGQPWYIGDAMTPDKSVSTNLQSVNANVQTQESVVVMDTTPKAVGNGSDNTATPVPPKMTRGRKRKQPEPSASESLPFRIYHKNRGRSERIYKQQLKKNTGFGPNGEGSTPESAFSV